ncbi:hypothetical protein EV182_000264, partial [Spiromyces aspiralis]
ARASISPPCTPVRQGTGTGGSGRSNAAATPIRTETTISLDDPRNEAIKKWAEYTEPFTDPASLDGILEMAGLKTAYDEFIEKFDVTIDRIMAALAKKKGYLRKGTRNSEAKSRLRPEELLEAQFTALCNVMLECLEAEVPPAQLPAVINKFRVGGNTRMSNCKGVSKKRVDIALVRNGADSTSWFDILLNIEVKSDADRILPLHRGQYAWYAAEEWPRQVRHYLLGGVLARSQLYVYYNDRNRAIYEASVGKLLLSKPNESVGGLRSAVTFILFLLTRTETELGLAFEDAAQDLHTLHIARPVNSTDGAIVATTLKGLGDHSPDMSISGLKLVRQLRKIVGHASWLFKGTRKDGHGRPDVYVKFDAQDDRRESEIRVMDRLKAHGVQHSAQLIKAFKLKGHNKFRYELLALEDHGEPIDEYFVWLEKHKALNAGVVRTVVQQILTALGQAERAQVLHRDVSAGNIVVKWPKGGTSVQATLIDWGYAKITSDSDDKPDERGDDPITGTVVFMSLRVLRQFPRRTIIDDIESLFHVLCYALVAAYAPEQLKYAYWSDADPDQLARSRYPVLAGDLDPFMSLVFGNKDLNKGIRVVLKDFKDILFDRQDVGKIYKDRLTDPREEKFDELAETLERKFDLEPLTFARNGLDRARRATDATPVRLVDQQRGLAALPDDADNGNADNGLGVQTSDADGGKAGNSGKGAYKSLRSPLAEIREEEEEGKADAGYSPGLMLPLRAPETPSPATAGGTLWDKWAHDHDTEGGKENQQPKQRQTPPQGEVPKGPTTRSKVKQRQAEQQRWAKGKRQT